MNLEHIKQKFKSGNEIPVPGAYVTQEEFQFLLSQMKSGVVSRKSFEDWALTEFTHPFLCPDPLKRGENGDYEQEHVELCWSAWKAAVPYKLRAPVADERAAICKMIDDLEGRAKEAKRYDDFDDLGTLRLLVWKASAPVAREAVPAGVINAARRAGFSFLRHADGSYTMQQLDTATAQTSEAVEDKEKNND